MISDTAGTPKLLVEIMTASGRRAVDVQRIRSSAVIFENGRFFVTLEKDKKNSLPVNFSFDFSDSIFLAPGDCVKRLVNILGRSEKPFEAVNLRLRFSKLLEKQPYFRR